MENLNPLPKIRVKTREQPDPRLQMEYDQINENFRMLADIRFKLLALVPLLSGVATFALSSMAGPESTKPWQNALFLLAGTLGFLATLGITSYDQRNSELYDALIGRAKLLEHYAGLVDNPVLETSKKTPGGQFLERPGRGRKLIGLISLGHDTGLALIYGSVLGAWFFPIAYSAIGLWKPYGKYRAWAALALASVMVVVFIVNLLSLAGTFKDSRVGTVVGWNKTTRLSLRFLKRGEPDGQLCGELNKKCRVLLLDGKRGALGDIADNMNVKVYYRKRKNEEGSANKPVKISKVELLCTAQADPANSVAGPSAKSGSTPGTPETDSSRLPEEGPAVQHTK